MICKLQLSGALYCRPDKSSEQGEDLGTFIQVPAGLSAATDITHVTTD